MKWLSLMLVVLLSACNAPDKSNDYFRFVVSSLSPDKVLKPLNLVERDVGFGINVHAKKGEIATKNILGSTTKRIRTDEFSLFYFNFESNHGITTFGEDGYAAVLQILEKIKQDKTVKLPELSRALLLSLIHI